MLKLGVHKTFKGKRLYKEVWKDIDEYEGFYQVSNMGRVKSLDRKINRPVGKSKIKGKILKPCVTNKGYETVNLSKEGVEKLKTVHRLVATTFIPNPENKPCIDHVNTIRTDNRVKNLKWATYSENNNNELTRKRNGKARKGRKISERTKEKIRNGCTTKRKIMCIETGVIYESIREAERQTGIKNGGMRAVCKGERKTAGGYSWRYV